MTDEILGSSPKPRNVIELIGQDAIDAAEKSATSYGGKLNRVIVSVWVDGIGQPDAVVCGQGIEGPADLFAFLISEAVSTGKQLGLSVKVLNVGAIGHD